MNRAEKPNRRNSSDLTAEQQEIVRRLNSARENERTSAEQDLQKMGAEALPILRHVLASRLEKVSRADKIHHNLWVAGTVFPTLVAFLMGKLPFEATIEGLVGFLFSLLFCIGGSYCISGFALGFGRMFIWEYPSYNPSFRPTQESAIRVLKTIEDVQATGLLAEIVRWLANAVGISEESAATARTALIRLIPRLNTPDYLALTQREKDCLYSLLRDYSEFLWKQPGDDDPGRGVPRSEFDVPMTITLLQLYGRVGDTRAASHIKRLIRAYPRAICYDVHETAIAALEGLKERSGEWDTATTHLRASSAPAAPDEELLIPAASAPPTEAQELLRADIQETKASPSSME